MQIIQVKFDSTNHTYYSYLCRFDVKVGDRVIVNSPSTGLTTVTVVQINSSSHLAVLKEVVATLGDVQKSHKRRQKTKRKLAKVEAKLSERLLVAQENKAYDELEETLGDDAEGVDLLKKMRRLSAKLRG